MEDSKFIRAKQIDAELARLHKEIKYFEVRDDTTNFKMYHETQSSSPDGLYYKKGGTYYILLGDKLNEMMVDLAERMYNYHTKRIKALEKEFKEL